MRRANLPEIYSLIIGFLLVIGSFLVKIPPTLRRVNLLEGYLLKLILFLVGLIILLFALFSVFSKQSLFYKKKWKKLFVNLTVLLVTVVICLAILEIFLQVTSPKGCGQVDPVFHHSYIPSCSGRLKAQEWDTLININSEGLRDDEISPKKNFDKRILLLGDSFLMGYGVNEGDRYSDLLEKKLKGNGYDVDIVNAGVTSYSSLLEYLYLREKGLRLEPDVIILLFDMGDVYKDNSYEKIAVKENDTLVAVPGDKGVPFLRKLYTRLKIVQFFEAPLVILDGKLKNKKIWGSQYFYDITYDRYAVTRFGLDKEKEMEYWTLSLRNLKMINKLAKEHNITFVLATYPYGHQVSGDEWAAGRHNFGFDVGKVYSDRPEKILQIFADINDIPLISLFDGFKQSNEFPLYFPYDGHFNENGHQLAAEILYKELIKLGLVN